MTYQSETFYRHAAADGATYIGMLLVVYDSLALDLHRAGDAVEGNNIAARCDASNHALLLLGHLDGWTSSVDDTQLASSLKQFYGYLRAEILARQAKPTPEGFRQLAALVGETRAVWQKKEASCASPAPRHVEPSGGSNDANEAPRLSWSA